MVARAAIAACRRKRTDRVAITTIIPSQARWLRSNIAPDLVIVGRDQDGLRRDHRLFLERAGSAYSARGDCTREGGGVVGVVTLRPLPPEAMGGERLLPIIDLVDALEVSNARCIHPADNRCARAIAQEHGADVRG
jgi:hypothetical protein